MKNLIVLFIITLTMFSCNQESPRNISDGQQESETIPMTNSDDFVLEQTGTFSNRNGYRVSGTAELYYSASTNVYSLRFQNFSSQNGPALRVYISEDETENSIINLGNLSSTSGAQRYDFAAVNYDPSKDTVLIWCDAIDQPFGAANF